MTIQYEIKSQLAKLLATEDLIVEHKRVETAQFNVKTRVLTLPMWDNTTENVVDMLVSHEVGHALYTPNEEWYKDTKVNPSIVNIVEDARIEKLMKRRYPGLPKTFYRGYGQLYEDDFFETQGKSIDEFSFPDRINLYFKVGPFLRIEFDDDEQYFVNKIDNVDTFDDVLDVSLELRDYLFDKMSNEESTGANQQVEVNVPGSNLEASSGEDEESIPRPEEEIADDFNTEESDETPSEEKENVPAENSAGDRCNNEFETETVTSLDNKLKDMVDKGKVESTYVEIPEIHLEDILVSSDDIRDELNSYWQEEIASRKEHDKIMSQRYPDNYTPRDMFGESDAQFNQFKKDSAKEVNRATRKAAFRPFNKEEVEDLKEYSPNVTYQAKGGRKSGKLGKSSVYSLRDKDESKKDFRKSHVKDIKDGLLKKEELAFEGWQDRAKEAMRKVAGKKPPKKHDYGRDAGKVARELMRKKDHQTVNFLDPDD